MQKVVDTVGKLLDFMSEFIVRNDPKMRKRDGSLSLPGYGQRKTMFRDLVKRCMMMGRNVVFVAHAQEEKVGDDYVVRPIVGGSSINDIMGELDLLGLLVNFGGKRLQAHLRQQAYPWPDPQHRGEGHRSALFKSGREVCQRRKR